MWVRIEEDRFGPKKVDQLQCAGELSVRNKMTRALPPDVRQGVLSDMQVWRCRAGFEGRREGGGMGSYSLSRHLGKAVGLHESKHANASNTVVPQPHVVAPFGTAHTEWHRSCWDHLARPGAACIPGAWCSKQHLMRLGDKIYW